MRTFPAALEMGIAQHTTRGEDRPLLSPIAGRVEGFLGERVGGERVGRKVMTCRCVGGGSGRKAQGVVRRQKSGQGWDPLSLPNHDV